MATFTISGYEVRSTPDNQVSSVKQAELQIVSTLGSATLAFDYVSDQPDSAEISLSDYNILINGIHLNDGVLPERIELFDFKCTTEAGPHASQVMNFAYEKDEGLSDFIFSVGEGALPDLSNPHEIEGVFKTAEFALVKEPDGDGGFQIQLEAVPDVSIDGVIFKLFDETPDPDPADTFSFFQKSDMDQFDATSFDFISAAVDEDTNPAQADKAPDYVVADPVPEFTPDPSFDDFAG